MSNFERREQLFSPFFITHNFNMINQSIKEDTLYLWNNTIAKASIVTYYQRSKE